VTKPRPGEIVLPFDPADRPDTGITFIGRIRSPWTNDGTHPRNIRTARERGGKARVELNAPYALGLLGLSVGQAVILVYWMDQARRDIIVQTPGHADGPRGTFALRSPVRPNSLAMSTVLITGIDGATLHVDAIDCFDETPLVDIKPWIPTIDTPPAEA